MTQDNEELLPDQSIEIDLTSGFDADPEPSGDDIQIKQAFCDRFPL